ncbi:MAG: hypothetical protein VX392_03945 [Verrucomicrobiota bacterium]|nr:hypothetical protein [Verrucomicrobiota bacterium]
MAAVALLVACGPADITSPEPTGNQIAPAPESVPTSETESKPAPEPAQLAIQPAPASKPAPAPAVPSPEPKATEPEPDAEPKHAPEPVAAVPPIRQPSRERFVEEQRLELKEQRWHVLGEPEPYTGYTKRWTVEGWKQAEGAYLNGLQHGRWKTWWDNGNLRTVIEFSNGKPNGPATHWYANGQRKTEGAFVDGQFTATAKWDEAGEPISPDSAPEP